jgi:lipopolysaccharide transport system ATP-binding protein
VPDILEKMTETLVKVENVSKKFCRDLKRSLWYGVMDIADELLGRKKDHERPLRKEEFWAIKSVSFELARGECLGLIGHNGAGKSTLLKMLSGLIKPDDGVITVKGRIGALIELGAGFNPVLTGRENVYVNGQILGFKKREIDKKFDAIVDFAEISEFIDMPVGNYSSGMKVRLGFAVAAQMDPDVLIIDEVLAVGDVGFRAKCLNAINEMSQKAAVIFVSHTMPQIARISTKGLLMNRGETQYYGPDVARLIELYYATFGNTNGIKTGSMRGDIHAVRLSSSVNQEREGEMFKVSYLDKLQVDIIFEALKSVRFLSVNFGFYDKELRGAAQAFSLNSPLRIENTGQKMWVRAIIPELDLNPGVYSLSVTIADDKRGEILVYHHACKSFQVVGDFTGSTPVLYKAHWELVDV